MRRARAIVVLAAIAGSIVSAGTAQAAPAGAPFSTLAYTATYNAASGTVRFVIVFNQQPDFRSTDSFGRQANSFQLFIVGDPTLGYPANFDSIVRGEELHWTGDSLVIRNSAPSDDGDPHSGGWGSIRGEVPISVRGHVVIFSVPVAVLSDHLSQPTISYQIESYEYGSETFHGSGEIRLR